MKRNFPTSSKLSDTTDQSQTAHSQNKRIRAETPSEQIIASITNLFSSLDSKDQANLLFHLIDRSEPEVKDQVFQHINTLNRKDFISLLPTEISELILSNLNLRTLGLCCQVSTTWNNIVSNSILPWKRILYISGFKDKLNQYPFSNVPKELMTPVSPQTGSVYKNTLRSIHLTSDNWLYGNGREFAFNSQCNDVITHLKVIDNRIIASSDDRRISVYDTKDGKLIHCLEGHQGGVWCFDVCGKGYNTLVSGSTDRTIRVWDLETGKCMKIFQGHISTIRCLIIVPKPKGKYSEENELWTSDDVNYDGEFWVVSGSRDKTVNVWELNTGSTLDVQANKQLRKNNISVDGTEEESLYENSLGIVSELDSDDDDFDMTEDPLITFTGHHASVRALASQAGIVVSGSYDHTVKVFSLYAKKCLYTLRGHEDKVYSVLYDFKSKRVISGSMDSSIRIWSRQTGQCIGLLQGHMALVGLLKLTTVNFVPSGWGDRRAVIERESKKPIQFRLLVSAAADSTIAIWDFEQMRLIRSLQGQEHPISSMDVNSNYIVTGSQDCVKLWDLKRGEFVRNLVTNATSTWKIHTDDARSVIALRSGERSIFKVLDFEAQ